MGRTIAFYGHKNTKTETTQMLPISSNDVRKAAQRINGHIHRTPVLTSQFFDRKSGKSIHFKCENFQKTGSFKIRGACNALFSLGSDARGVVAHSSGNFAQAVTYAARLRGLRTHIIMPENSLRSKVDAVKAYGGEITFCGMNPGDRESMASKVHAKHEFTHLVHPYNDVEVMAGQGTIALELMDQVSELDAIVCPIGGGGMASGIAVAAKSAEGPHPLIICAEPKGADDAFRSLKEGRLIPQTNPQTIADGLRTSLGSNTWEVVQNLVDRIITVEEHDIIDAMKLVYQRMKLVIEPSSAVAVAAILTEEFRSIPNIHRVGVVLSGGNVDIYKIGDLFSSRNK
eukprot:518170_1